MKHLVASTLLFLSLLAPSAQAVPVVVGATDGSNGNSYPWDVTGGMHWQQVFSASELTGFVGQNLNQIAYQTPDTLGYTIASLVISISTSVNGPGTLSSTFANNLGADNTVVFNQTNVVAGAFASTGGYNFALPFMTPFLYTGGDLLLDVVAGDSSSGTNTFYIANDNGLPLTERVFGPQGSPAATTGTVRGSGTLVTQLNFSAVAGAPEMDPDSAAIPFVLMIFGGLLTAGRRRATAYADWGAWPSGRQAVR